MKSLLSIAVLAAAWSAWAQGAFEAISDYSQSASTSISGTAGWAFQPNTSLTVTNLGCFAYVFDNLAVTSIQVGLWDHNGSLLASTSITPASILLDQTLYGSVTPVLLIPGQIYAVGVFSPGGSFGLDASTSGSFSTTTDINVLGTASVDGAFAFPSLQPLDGAIYAGPNFVYFEGGVPEPSSGLLLCLGGLLLAARRVNQRSL